MSMNLLVRWIRISLLGFFAHDTVHHRGGRYHLRTRVKIHTHTHTYKELDSARVYANMHIMQRP